MLLWKIHSLSGLHRPDRIIAVGLFNNGETVNMRGQHNNYNKAHKQEQSGGYTVYESMLLRLPLYYNTTNYPVCMRKGVK